MDRFNSNASASRIYCMGESFTETNHYSLPMLLVFGWHSGKDFGRPRYTVFHYSMKEQEQTVHSFIPETVVDT